MRPPRWLPDALTAARFPLALGLLAAEPLGGAFFTCYALCGVTDALDGPLARRLGTASFRGARLDSAADLAVTAAVLGRLLPLIELPGWLLAWLAGIAALRLAAVWVGWQKWGKVGFLHSWLNKATGAALFLWPWTLLSAWGLWAAGAVCALAAASAGEELAVACTAKVWDPDRRGLWARE